MCIYDHLKVFGGIQRISTVLPPETKICYSYFQVTLYRYFKPTSRKKLGWSARFVYAKESATCSKEIQFVPSLIHILYTRYSNVARALGLAAARPSARAGKGNERYVAYNQNLNPTSFGVTQHQRLELLRSNIVI